MGLRYAVGGPLASSVTGEPRSTQDAEDSIERPAHVYTPEDVLLHKLRWYRNGGGRSDRPWRDVIGIVRVQGGDLDRRYLTEAAGTLGVSDLLVRALEE